MDTTPPSSPPILVGAAPTARGGCPPRAIVRCVNGFQFNVIVAACLQVSVTRTEIHQHGPDVWEESSIQWTSSEDEGESFIEAERMLSQMAELSYHLGLSRCYKHILMGRKPWLTVCRAHRSRRRVAYSAVEQEHDRIYMFAWELVVLTCFHLKWGFLKVSITLRCCEPTCEKTPERTSLKVHRQAELTHRYLTAHQAHYVFVQYGLTDISRPFRRV